ncbi:unnamed protein product [Penicillium viridicatum]
MSCGSLIHPSLHLPSIFSTLPPNITPTQVVLLLSSYATNLRIRPSTRVDVGSNPVWRRALREELRAAPVEDSVSQFGHIRRAQSRQMSAV